MSPSCLCPTRRPGDRRRTPPGRCRHHLPPPLGRLGTPRSGNGWARPRRRGPARPCRPLTIPPPPLPRRAGPAPARAPPLAPEASAPAPEPAEPPPDRVRAFATVAFLVWGLGSLYLGARLVYGYRRLGRLCSRSRPLDGERCAQDL